VSLPPPEPEPEPLLPVVEPVLGVVELSVVEPLLDGSEPVAVLGGAVLVVAAGAGVLVLVLAGAVEPELVPREWPGADAEGELEGPVDVAVLLEDPSAVPLPRATPWCELLDE
jgi:hypothetical protein